SRGRRAVRAGRAARRAVRAPPGEARHRARRLDRGPLRRDAERSRGQRREHSPEARRQVIPRLIAFALHQRFVTIALAVLLPCAELPSDVKPTIAPLSSIIGEIFRYTLSAPSMPLYEVKAVQDWVLEREFLKVPGVADVISWGGGTKQYQVTVDPGRLRAYN